MLRRLRVRGYKSLVDCTVDLTPLTVVFGPNGAGKSNLLDLIGLLSRLASRETVREAFEDHRGRPLEAFHSPEGFAARRFAEFLERDRLSFTAECDLELHPRVVESVNRSLEQREESLGVRATYTRVSETLLRYSVTVTLTPRTGDLSITDESLRALRRDLQPKADSVRKAFFERERDDGGTERFVARIERQAHPRYFEPHRQRTLLAELSDPVYHPHVVAAAREIASWRVYYVEPTRMRREIGVQAADEPGRSGELLAAYYYLLQQQYPATFRSVVRHLQVLVPGLEDVRVDVRDGLLEIVSVQAGGAEFPARLLSEGTLRLMCVLGIAVAPSAPALVGYEEPENGVNPGRLDLITQVLRGAVFVRPDGPQFLITTHSALVCDLLPEHLVLCTRGGHGGTEFRRFPWNRESLFFQREILRALDQANAPPIEVRETPPAPGEEPST